MPKPKHPAATDERRRHPRSQKCMQWNIGLQIKTYDLVAEVKDLSCIGAYCRVNKPIDEMTHLKLVMNLPADQIECSGTVVRSESSTTAAGFRKIAIFFDDISEADQNKISNFIGV